MKRSPLRRGGPLRRRTRLAPMSAKRRASMPARAEVREAVFRRDGGCVLAIWADLAGPCFGPLTFHHRRKASAGGAYSEANGLTLCARHNGWVEDAPSAARELDPRLVVRAGDSEWVRLGEAA